MNGVYFPNSAYPEEDKIDNNNKKRNINDFYIEDLLKNNKKKKVKIYCSFSNGDNKYFEGILEDVQSDYLVISEPANNNWIVVMIMYLNYIDFKEEISFN